MDKLGTDRPPDISEEEKYFNVKVQKREYPSCYQYNVLIMLAKRLLNQKKEKINACHMKNLFSIMRY